MKSICCSVSVSLRQASPLPQGDRRVYKLAKCLPQAFAYEGRFLINPGSVTGAYSNVTQDVKPSFVLMDIDGSKVMRCVLVLSWHLSCITVRC